MKPGDKIRYKSSFLRTIGDYSHESATRTAIVLPDSTFSINSKGRFLHIQWDDEGRPSHVNKCNVEPINTITTD